MDTKPLEKFAQAARRQLHEQVAARLDRVLTTGRYVIPIYSFNVSRIAHAKELKFPDALPIYGDWIGWQPDVWWYEE